MFEWEERRNLRTTECLVNTPSSMFLFHFHTTQHRWCPLWSMPSSLTSRKRPFLFWTMLSWSSDAFCQAAELHSLLLLIHVNSQRKEESGNERERECINMCVRTDIKYILSYHHLHLLSLALCRSATNECSGVLFVFCPGAHHICGTY